MPYIARVRPANADPTVRPSLDGDTGRRDAPADLRVRLSTASADYLTGALENPRLGVDGVELILRNRAATAAIVARIGRNRAWMRARELKVALVNAPAAPYAIARSWLPHLLWRDLAEVASNLKLSPVLRREAETILRARLPELAVGERVSLARVGSRGVIVALSDDPSPAVLQALAGNPRSTESDLVRIVSRADAPPEFLGWMASSSPWEQRHAVRLALVRQPRTPAAAALRVTGRLTRHDLDALRHDPMAPRLVRVAADRRAGTRETDRDPRSSVG